MGSEIGCYGKLYPLYLLSGGALFVLVLTEGFEEEAVMLSSSSGSSNKASYFRLCRGGGTGGGGGGGGGVNEGEFVVEEDR